MLYWIGESYLKKKRYDEAISAYRKLIVEYDKGFYMEYAYYSLGWCYRHKNEDEKGIEIFNELVKKFPESKLFAKTCLSIGSMEYGLKHYDIAEDNFRKVLMKFKKQ